MHIETSISDIATGIQMVLEQPVFYFNHYIPIKSLYQAEYNALPETEKASYIRLEVTSYEAAADWLIEIDKMAGNHHTRTGYMLIAWLAEQPKCACIRWFDMELTELAQLKKELTNLKQETVSLNYLNSPATARFQFCINGKDEPAYITIIRAGKNKDGTMWYYLLLEDEYDGSTNASIELLSENAVTEKYGKYEGFKLP